MKIALFFLFIFLVASVRIRIFRVTDGRWTQSLKVTGHWLCCAGMDVLNYIPFPEAVYVEDDVPFLHILAANMKKNLGKTFFKTSVENIIAMLSKFCATNSIAVGENELRVLYQEIDVSKVGS